MTVELWLTLVIAMVGVIGTWLCYWVTHKTYKLNRLLVKQIKNAEWSLIERPDYDEWIFERTAPGKVKVYGYVISQFAGHHKPIVKKFDSPVTYFEGSKLGIREELDGNNWDLILYYNDYDYVEKDSSGQFPKDSEQWIYPVA